MAQPRLSATATHLSTSIITFLLMIGRQDVVALDTRASSLTSELLGKSHCQKRNHAANWIMLVRRGVMPQSRCTRGRKA